MIDQQVIKKVITIGQKASIDNADTKDILASIKNCDSINREHWREWNGVTCKLADDDLEALVKGLTIAETYHKWCGGSVSAVIWTFREFERRNSKKALSLADWILPRTQNSYVPFGGQNYGAKSIKDYLKLKRDHDEKIARGLKDQELSEKLAAKNNLERKKQRASSTQNRNTQERNNFLRDLENLSLKDQLIKLANDNQYSVEFYPTSCAYIGREIIDSLDKKTKGLLLEKLKGRRKGPWKKLKRQLLAEFQKDTYDQSTPWDRKGWFKER